MEKKTKNGKTELKVVVTNPLSKTDVKKKEKELCDFLDANWYTKINEKS